MSALTCPECGTTYPKGTPMCLDDGHIFVKTDAGQQSAELAEEPIQLPAPRNGKLARLEPGPGPQFYIDVTHVDGTDFPPGTHLQHFPLEHLTRGELRVGRRTRGKRTPYQPEVDFLDLIRDHALGGHVIISRLQATLLMDESVPAIRHQPDQITTWIRRSGSPDNRALRPNQVAKLRQRDVITFGKPALRYVRVRVWWDE